MMFSWLRPFMFVFVVTSKGSLFQVLFLVSLWALVNFLHLQYPLIFTEWRIAPLGLFITAFYCFVWKLNFHGHIQWLLFFFWRKRTDNIYQYMPFVSLTHLFHDRVPAYSIFLPEVVIPHLNVLLYTCHLIGHCPSLISLSSLLHSFLSFLLHRTNSYLDKFMFSADCPLPDQPLPCCQQNFMIPLTRTFVRCSPFCICSPLEENRSYSLLSCFLDMVIICTHNPGWETTIQSKHSS